MIMFDKDLNFHQSFEQFVVLLIFCSLVNVTIEINIVDPDHTAPARAV